jgi:hypothetical protein
MGVDDWAALYIDMPPVDWTSLGVSRGGLVKILGSRCMICDNKKFNTLIDLDGHLRTRIHQVKSKQSMQRRAVDQI